MRVAVNAARSRTQRGLVRGGDDDDRPGQALGAEVVLDELADLTAALADERDAPTRRPRCPRAIIDSRLDLPTPEPAKMPSRWPRPHGTSVSSARTPRPSWVSIRRRASAGAVACRRAATSTTPVSGGPPSIGSAEAVEDAAEQAGTDRTVQRPAQRHDRAADRTPAELAERHADQPPCSPGRRPRPGPGRAACAHARRRRRSADVDPGHLDRETDDAAYLARDDGCGGLRGGADAVGHATSPQRLRAPVPGRC